MLRKLMMELVNTMGEILIPLIIQHYLVCISSEDMSNIELSEFKEWFYDLDKSEWMSPNLWKYNTDTNFIEVEEEMI